MLTLVLYPYVYLLSRAAFLEQSVCVLEVSRTLGCGPWRCFFAVALPLARPAVVAGVTLVLMVVLVLFLTKTKYGIHMRAAAEDFRMARMLGIEANRVIMLAVAISGMLAETRATVTALVMPWPTTSIKAPPPMVLPPIKIALPQGALRRAAPPSSHHHKGSKQALARAMRAAVKGSGGTLAISKSAAGSAIAHTSMDNMHSRLARTKFSLSRN